MIKSATRPTTDNFGFDATHVLCRTTPDVLPLFKTTGKSVIYRREGQVDPEVYAYTDRLLLDRRLPFLNGLSFCIDANEPDPKLTLFNTNSVWHLGQWGLKHEPTPLSVFFPDLPGVGKGAFTRNIADLITTGFDVFRPATSVKIFFRTLTKDSNYDLHTDLLPALGENFSNSCTELYLNEKIQPLRRGDRSIFNHTLFHREGTSEYGGNPRFWAGVFANG